MRSRRTLNGYGHQATYDSNGNLIEAGISAGTADRGWYLNFAIGGPIHLELDVKPFIWAAQLDANPVEGFDWIDGLTNYRLTWSNLDDDLMHVGDNLQSYLQYRPAHAGPADGQVDEGNCIDPFL